MEKKNRIHFCEKCAQEKGEIYMFNEESGFSINNLLAGLFNIDAYYPAATPRSISEAGSSSM